MGEGAHGCFYGHGFAVAGEAVQDNATVLENMELARLEENFGQWVRIAEG